MQGLGTNNINAETFHVLDDLREGRLTGNAARSKLIHHASTLTEDDVKVLQMILDGKLRVGLGIKSLNKVLRNKIPIHEVMLASQASKHPIRYPVWVSPKLDGMRGSFSNSTMLTRTGKPVIGVTDIVRNANTFGIPMDGELMVDGMSFQKSLGLLRSHAEVPEAKFYVFDVPIRNLSFEKRLELLSQVKGVYNNIKVLTHKLVHNEDELMDYYHKCRLAGLEGVVIKRPGHQYVGTRSMDWLKMKAVETVDVPIVGFNEGEGKYEGTLGALVVKLDNGQLCDVGSGFSDLERDAFWNNKGKYLVKIIEVLYHENTDDGNLRHPRFHRIRTDK
jgi:DNA ligase-1